LFLWNQILWTWIFFKQINGIWFGTYKLHAIWRDIRQYLEGQNNKPPVDHIPVPVKQQGLRSYAMVVWGGNQNNLSTVIQEKQSKDASGSPTVPMHFNIIHDPVGEEIVWMRNSLVEVISEGVNYQEIKHASIDNGVQFTGFGLWVQHKFSSYLILVMLWWKHLNWI